MIIEAEKWLTKNELREVAITRWMKPKGFKLSICEFSNKMFGLNLILVHGEIKEFSKFIKDKNDYTCEHESAKALFVWTKNPKSNETEHYIVITECDWYADDYGTICHELHHFTHFGLESIGIDYGRAGEELFAYFQGYFMTSMVKAFQELKKVTSKKIKKRKK